MEESGKKNELQEYFNDFFRTFFFLGMRHTIRKKRQEQINKMHTHALAKKLPRKSRRKREKRRQRTPAVMHRTLPSFAFFFRCVSLPL